MSSFNRPHQWPAQVFINTSAMGVGCEAEHAEGAHPLKKLLGTFAIMLQGMELDAFPVVGGI